MVVSGDEIKKLQDMVVYRFWLRELNTLDLQDITAQAQINNMTESEYLARNGEVLWNLYFIQAVPRAETIADYSSYIENPSSNRDPKGELRQFDYWYTLDEFGNRVRLNLTDPTSKMSKSDKDPNGCVYMLEKPEDIMRKFKKAVTDSEACVRFDPANKPGVSNLMQIYAVATGKSFASIEQEFAGHGYGDFKQAVGESVVELLRPIREETERLLADKTYLESVYRAGAEKAAYVANRTLNKVYKKVGFLPR